MYGDMFRLCLQPSSGQLVVQIRYNYCAYDMGSHKDYHIYRPLRRTFFPENCDLNSNFVLCAEGKYYFQTYKYPYPHRVKKKTMKMILVAVTKIFWVSMIHKLTSLVV